MSSRVNTTAILAKAIAASEDAPSVWISTSGASFYPPDEAIPYDETSVINLRKMNWASELMAKVEKAAEIHNPKSLHTTRSVTMRIGMVLGQEGGVYKNLHRPFHSCLGGTFGDGSQYFPWVHISDAVRAYEFAILDLRVKDVLNVVAPKACTNEDFSRAVGRAISRPTFIPIPKFVSLLLGKDRGPMLFDGQNVKPNALTSLGFKFDFPDITSCCVDLSRGK